jgi:gluconate 2-dehydrogenase gamma chain
MRRLPVPAGSYLDDEAKRQVAVLFEAILPGTPAAPGAGDAGAAGFLDVLLSADPEVFYEVAGWRKRYAAALPALDAVARSRFGRPLADLGPDEARDLVASLAAGRLDGLPPDVDQRQLFATLRGHCIEGCFSDPRWGGNRDRVVWRWLGYGQPPEDWAGTR